MKIFTVIIVILSCLSLKATNWYVSPIGNDSYPGTYLLPYRTIQKAADIVNPGDTVIVRDGTYTNTIANFDGLKTVVILKRSGNSSGWITFKAENKGGAIIDGLNYDASTGFMIFNGTSYIRVEGFEIKRLALHGMYVFPASHHIEFKNNYIHHIGNTCVTSATDSNGRVAFNLLSCYNILVEKNLVDNIGRLTPTEGCIGAQNYMWMDHGVYADNVANLVVRNNIFTECNNGWSIHFYSGKNLYSTNISIFNNTFYVEDQQAPGHIILSSPISAINIANNLFIMNPEVNVNGTYPNVGIYISSIYEPYIKGGSILYNMMYRGNGVIASPCSGLTRSNNLVNTNPLVTDLSASDFRLQSTSPAINAGVEVGVTTDFSGNAIVDKPDIGAFEYWPSSVSISSPFEGAQYSAPASVTINASATPAFGAIVKIDFYIGSTLLGSDNTSPYSYTMTNVPVGSYSITARATNNIGASTTSTPVAFWVVSNQFPVVSISSPISGTLFTAPASITISASASESDGTIAKVDFYNGSVLLVSDKTSPYSYTATNVLAGSYSITAKATDNTGASTTSTPVAITVGASNQHPNASIITPASGAVFTAPASVTISATATDSDGTVTKVEFYNESILLGSDNSSPYSYTWTNVTQGSYSITAKATDNTGASTTSPSVSITISASNQPPVVSISSPVSGTILTAPTSVTISASAIDTDGTITKVDFYQESTLLESDYTSPYSFSGTNVPVGNYAITARATDNSGASTTSSPVTITVFAPNLPPVISIASPVSGSIFNALTSLTIAAYATDADGTITKVDFYNGNVLLGSDYASPYSYTVSNVPSGNYTITAKASDNAGASTTSPAVTVAFVSFKSGLLQPSMIETNVVESSIKSQNLVCYPVPFNNLLHIEFIPSDGESVITIEIVNMAGKCELNQLLNDTKIIMDLPNLKPGLYIVKVRSNIGIYNKVVIKN